MMLHGQNIAPSPKNLYQPSDLRVLLFWQGDPRHVINKALYLTRSISMLMIRHGHAMFNYKAVDTARPL